MPLLKLQTSSEISNEDKLMESLSAAVSDVTGKPEQYIMIALEKGTFMMGSKKAVAAFAEVRGIGGINREINKKLSERICSIINEELGIPAERIYINFFDIPASNWGWNSSTFG